MKLLNGSELAAYIKERQARQVRALRQAHAIYPKLAILQTIDDPVIDTYVRMKRRYGDDILVDVEVYRCETDSLLEKIELLNQDNSVHAMIIQLPLADETQTDAAVNLVAPHKDVDGLGIGAVFTPATPMAIDWLLAGYNVSLKDRHIAVIGNGRLVGAPLTELWRTAGHNVTVYDEHSNLDESIFEADIIITAAGVPNLVTSAMVKHKAVVVDAATSAEHGKIVGDVADEVRTREDVSITPQKGGVGPLTVAALFDNVIRAAQASKTESES